MKKICSFLIFLLIFYSGVVKADIFNMLNRVSNSAVINVNKRCSGFIDHYGTAFIIKVDNQYTYWMTCAHCVATPGIPVILQNNPMDVRKGIIEEVGEYNREENRHNMNVNDYAIIKTAKRPGDIAVKVAHVADYSNLIGSELYIINCEQMRTPSINLVKCIGADQKYIHYEPPVMQGASGSPIFNKNLEVVGIVEVATQNMGSGIKLKALPYYSNP